MSLLVLGILLTGCATGVQTVASSATGTPTPTPTSAVKPTPTPSTTPTPTPTPAPEIEPAVPVESAIAVEPAVPVQPPASIDPPAPVDPNSVDPADYVSTAVDDQNGGIPLPGVAFTVADGRIICGIMTWGHLSTVAGFVSCTPDTYREIYPQPVPEGPLFVKSIESDPVYGTAGLYPDWFAQPARAIPALPEGKNIRFEGTTCTAEKGGVTCTHDINGKGFFLTLEGYTYFT